MHYLICSLTYYLHKFEKRTKNQQYILSANAMTSPNKIACIEYSSLDGVQEYQISEQQHT